MVASSAVWASDGELVFEPLELHDDPYPLYRRLRAETPAYADPGGRFWALTRYVDVQAAARDWRRFSSAEGNDLDDTALLFAPAGELTHADPPLHTRLRDAIKREFGAAAVRARLEPQVRDEVRRVVGDLRGRECVDFAQTLALPLPAAVICGWLGFPEQDRPELLRWFRAMLERVPGQVELPGEALSARDKMRSYIREAMLSRRRRARDDLLTVFVQAEHAGTLSEDEVLGSAMLLFFAGITTTSALITSSILHLARFQSQRELLRESPQLAPAAVEELLRFDAPLQWLTRLAACDVRLHGRLIPRSSRVLLVWASANRDERRWPAADELIITREPKRHIAFGEGIHHCLGAPLARLEARIVLEELMPLMIDYELAGTIARLYTQTERTITRLPMQVRWR